MIIIVGIAALVAFETINLGKRLNKIFEALYTDLRKNKFVKSYRLGSFGEGDTGVTIIDLK